VAQPGWPIPTWANTYLGQYLPEGNYSEFYPEELEQLFRGYGYRPYFVEGDDPEEMHQTMAATLDDVVAEVQGIQSQARTQGFNQRPRWPMIVLRTANPYRNGLVRPGPGPRTLDPERNAAAVGIEARISANNAGVAARVIPVDDAAIIVRETLGCLAAGRTG
jgi:hypothetical protein